MVMRKFLFLMGLLVAAPVFAAVADEVKAAENEWLTGITKNDFRKLDQVLAEDLVYLHSTGVMDSKASYVKSLQSGKQKYVAGKINRGSHRK